MTPARLAAFLALCAALLCAAARAADAPSDDPDDWPVDPAVEYRPVLGEARQVVPSAALPARVRCLASNNNCSIALHEGRLFLAWRTAPIHFASPETRMVLVSSADRGATWDFEHEIALGADLREPTFLSFRGRLHFRWFEAGTNPLGFEPARVWRIERRGPGAWSERAAFGEAGEVPWEVKVRRGRAWQTSYRGGHYALSGPSSVDVLFKVSDDGVTWGPVDPERPAVYHGGVSEVAFELDEAGGLVAVTRLEDGDASGFGAHVATATAGALGRWTFPARADPERYDSPRMFRHGKDMYLLARRDPGGPFDLGLENLSFEQKRLWYLAAYSTRPKRTALYRIDRAARKPAHLFDLPSAGDTSFPSVVRTGAHTFLIANYTSPPADAGRSWIRGQLAADGTQIYLVELTMVPR